MESLENKCILLVDDEADIVKVISKRLEKSGYRVLTASGGARALEILEKHIPDLIILDINMPDIDGIETCRRIKNKKYMSSVPVIFFTARDSVGDKVKGLKEDVHDYITKPIDHRELLARIDSVLKLSKHYNEVSLTDELTGLYNYNYFQKQFSHSFDMAVRYSRAFSLVISDLDKFKQINDTYGHLFGNMVLKKVGDKLSETLRKVDIVCRYGGDEFAIILPETDRAQADEVAQRLRDAFGTIEINFKGRAVSLGLSFGFATYSEDIKTKEAFFNLADKDMYEDKKRHDKKKKGVTYEKGINYR